MSQIPSEQLRPNDKYIHRNRIGRWAVFLGYIAFVILVIGFGAQKVLNDLFRFDPVLGFMIGLSGVIVLLSATLWRFFIKVDLVSAFVTINLFVTFFSSKTEEKAPRPTLPTPEEYEHESPEERALDRMTFPVYGPGVHICYPWEERNREYNFSLEEVPASIAFEVLCTDGTVDVDGSYRIRPDFSNLIPFLSGVGTSAGELRDLITSYAFEKISGKTVAEAIKSLPELNIALMAKFGLKEDVPGRPKEKAAPEVSQFERRFGVFVGDVTIARILPSEEVQRTISSISEARAIAEGTAVMLSFSDAKALEAAVASKTVTGEQVSRARDRFMSVSGNLEGMNLTRFEVDLNVTGLDPETAKILAEGLSRVAPAAATALSGKSGSGPKKT